MALKISHLFDEQVYIQGVGYAGVDTVQQLSSKSLTALLNNDQYGKRYVDEFLGFLCDTWERRSSTSLST
jgi:hypothetical protein